MNFELFEFKAVFENRQLNQIIEQKKFFTMKYEKVTLKTILIRCNTHR